MEGRRRRKDGRKGEDGRKEGGGWMDGGGRMDGRKGEEGRMECVACANTSPCPTDSCRNEPIPLESAGMAQESGGMGRNPQEWNQNGTGMDRNGQEWHWNGLKWTFWS